VSVGYGKFGAHLSSNETAYSSISNSPEHIDVIGAKERGIVRYLFTG
jgi:hypothetical protein